jgi:hypothetical protein
MTRRNPNARVRPIESAPIQRSGSGTAEDLQALLDGVTEAPTAPERLDDADVLALMRELSPVVEHRRHHGLSIEDAEVYARTVLASDWLAQHVARAVAEARAEALREAADAWTQGEWANHMVTASDPAQIRIGTANRVGDWLRTRADREGQS